MANSKIIFVDRLTLLSFFNLLIFEHSFHSIRYFDFVSSSARRILKACNQMGLLHVEVSRVEDHIGQARDITGECEYARVFREALEVCEKIKKEILAPSLLIRKIASVWAFDKVLLHFGKRIEPEVRTELLRIALAEWIIRTQSDVPLSQCVLMIKRSIWFSYIKAYAHNRGIRLLAYREPFNIKGFLELISKLTRFSRKIPAGMYKAVLARLHFSEANFHRQNAADEIKTAERPDSLKIGVKFENHLNFDFSKPSDLFWLNGSGLPYSEILLYDYCGNEELDHKTRSAIKEHGIKIYGKGPDISAWTPTSRMFPLFLKSASKIFLAVMSCLIRGIRVPLYFIEWLINLAGNYAYWYDFYAANQVRVNVAPCFCNNVGQVLALDDLGAVSFAYQYSLFFTVPTPQNSSGEDVQFVYSRLSEERLWRSFEAPVGIYASIGCVQSNGAGNEGLYDIVAKTRERLEGHGARFVLCYFDEGSVNGWKSPVPDGDSAKDYKYLLEWLLSDPTLGIVVKPKRLKTLFQRIAVISPLLDKARQTGRIIILGEEDSGGAIYPSKAALTGDLCIGHLFGASAAFEAHLAGVATVLIDTLGLTNHPFYKWGRGGVIFENWESLRTAVENYRTDKVSHPEFGKWLDASKEIDPFQDGQAGLRMGLYIRYVYGALTKGFPKEEALKSANESFDRQWGKGYITSGNGY